MKLLTINTHSLIESKYEAKLNNFCAGVAEIKPDIIAMQEVNQHRASPVTGLGTPYNIKADNHALAVCRRLSDMGYEYNFLWQGIKEGYGKFDEGIALMSRLPIEKTKVFYLSESRACDNWRTRMALGAFIGGSWYYSVHTGRPDDREESFARQINELNYQMVSGDTTWLMGDFNCPDTSSAYKALLDLGWYDTRSLARKRDRGITVASSIDGWRDEEKAMRIDYIFANEPVAVKSSKVVFDGVNYDVVSDHFGVLVEI